MTDTADSEPTVLVVDDERELADLYAAWLAEEYAVRTAYGGQAAVEEIDESVDVVLLDRRMPAFAGDEVLEEISAREHISQVVMVSAVDPDFDIVGMDFDDYLTKPADRDELYAIVEGVLSRKEYDQQLRRYYQLVAKRDTLEAEKPDSQLENSEQFAALQERIAELEAEIGTDLDAGDAPDSEAPVREFDDS